MKKKVGSKLPIFLDRLEQSRFFKSIFKRLDYETKKRRALNVTPPGTLKKFFLATSAALILAFFIYQISFYYSVELKVQTNPRVWNLTKSKVPWNVYYGQSKQCGQIPCVLTPEGRKVKKQMVLPAREFPLLDWKPGEKVFLSATLKVPQFLLDSDQPLALYSLYVWAKQFTLYLNGKPFHQGGEETLFVSIPRQLVTADMNISFEIDPGTLPYQGLSNKWDLLLGPKVDLLRHAFSTLELQTTYVLWFLLPELILCIFLISIYLGFYRYREIFYLVLYLGSSSLYFLTTSLYYPDFLNQIINGFIFDSLVKSLSQIALLIFVHEYFRRYSLVFDRLIRFVTFFLITFSSAVLFLPPFRDWVDQRNLVKTVASSFYLASYGYGLVLAGLTAFYLRRKDGVSGIRRTTSTALYFVFLTILVTSGLVSLNTAGPKDHFIQNICSLILAITLSGVILIEFAVAFPERNFFRGFAFRFVNKKIVNEAYRSLKTLQPRRKQLSVLVVDIRNFTSYCEKASPENVIVLLSGARQIFTECAARNNGYLDKFTGDGALMLFGVLDTSQDFQLEAVRTAFEILSSSRKLSLELGMGISTGQAIVGEIGTELKSEYTALGNTVNRAFRVESLCKELGQEILVDETTMDAVASQVTSRAFRNQPIRSLGVRNIYALLDLVPKRKRKKAA